MPRIEYDQPQTSPGLALTDLATGLLGGYMQGEAQNVQRDRTQQEAAFGNPYERRKRAITWAALPDEVKTSAHAPVYQRMIMGGSDPMSILRAHQQMDSDPVYGDARTRQARESDLNAALQGGLLDPTDTAGQEGIRRGQMTLGQLLTDRQAAKRQQTAKDEERTEKAKTKAEGDREDEERASTLQGVLGVGQAQPGQTRERTPEEGLYLAQDPTVTTPGTPGVKFKKPADVEAAARIQGQRDAEANRQVDRTHDNALADRKAETARIIADAKRRGVSLTPEEEDDAAAALDIVNDPNAPETKKNRAKVKLRTLRMMGEGDMVAKPSAAARAANEYETKKLEALHKRKEAFNGNNGIEEMKQYAAENGIKIENDQATGRPKLDEKAKAAILSHITKAIAEQDQRTRDAGAALSPKMDPAAPAPAPDAAAIAAGDAVQVPGTAAPYPADVKTPEQRARYDRLRQLLKK